MARELKVKMTDTRDMLRSIDAVLAEGNDAKIRKALEDSIFPLVEDGNGPGHWTFGENGGVNLACETNEDGYYVGECSSVRCHQGAHNKGLAHYEEDDPFALAVWETNTFFSIDRNDFSDHPLGIEILNVPGEFADDDWGDRDPPE